MNTDDHMTPDVWTDSQTGIVYNDLQYDGPKSWAEDDLGCALRWDDMWLVPPEIHHMMNDIEDLLESKVRGLQWQGMRVVWRENIQHYVMEVPFYPAPVESDSVSA